MNRRLQRKLNDEWIDIDWEDIKKEMIIRMFEPNGTPISFSVPGDGSLHYEMFMLSDSYKENSIWTVDIDKVS